MPVTDNLVHETTTSTGTGNLTVAGVTGRRTLNTSFGTGKRRNIFPFDQHISIPDETIKAAKPFRKH